MKYLSEFKVSASQTDSGVGISVLGVCGIIQDNVCAFFAEFGKDNVVLKRDYGAVWVFVKNRFKKFSVAYWNETVTVESFISKRTSATLIVDTVVKKKDGNIAYYARTEACVLDLNEQRIRRISSIDLPENLEVYPPVIGLEFTRWNADDLNDLYEFTVPSTSIDYCFHLNNVEYLRFILNTVSAEYNRKFVPVDVEIHYVDQSKENEKLKIKGIRNGAEDRYEVINGDRVSARCRILRAE